MISPEVELSKKAGSRSSSFEYSLFFRDIVSLPPTQVLAYAERKLSSPCTVVKETIRTGIYQGEDMSLPTTTTSVYGFRNRAIAASSEPMGMVIRTDRSAGQPYGPHKRPHAAIVDDELIGENTFFYIWSGHGNLLWIKGR